MARRTITIDEKIDKAQAEVIKAKEKYEAAINELKELQEKKKEILCPTDITDLFPHKEERRGVPELNYCLWK